MDRKQTAELLQDIQVSYPGKFHVLEPTRLLNAWTKALLRHDHDKVQANFEKHLETSAFPPTIADLVREKPTDRLNAIPNVEETRAYLETLGKASDLTEEQKATIESEKAKIRKILGIQ